MIEVHTWPTPNGHKIHIMLEETGLEYEVRPVNIRVGEQFKPEFLRISPNNKIPAIVDRNGPDGKPIAIFESGAILIYLAAKTGKLLPRDDREKYVALQWLMFQMGSVGPMMGQAGHFRSNAVPERIEYAINRYTNEVRRLHRVMEKRPHCPPARSAGPEPVHGPPLPSARLRQRPISMTPSCCPCAAVTGPQSRTP